jgi:hypothetical protein
MTKEEDEGRNQVIGLTVDAISIVLLETNLLSHSTVGLGVIKSHRLPGSTLVSCAESAPCQHLLRLLTLDQNSRSDVDLGKVDGFSKCARGDLADVGCRCQYALGCAGPRSGPTEYEQNDGDGREDTGACDTVFSAHVGEVERG